jgi:glycosyltransferase involved in cell wall biosynthesis
MKVLQLCNKPPYPAIDGGCIAMKNISLGLLNNKVDLKMICISTIKHPFLVTNFPKDFVKKTNVEGVFLDTKINIVDAFSSIITSDCYNVSRFFSADLDIKIKQDLLENDYDFIILESLFLSPYIGTIHNNSDAKVVLRSHNFEYLIWERLAQKEKNILKKGYLKHLSSNLKKYETQIISDVNGIATISNEDTKKYLAVNSDLKITTIPFGIDFENYSPAYNKPNGSLKLFHIGSMDWNPNIEAIDWFLDSVWNSFKGNSIELHLAGKSMPNTLLNLNEEQIINHGQVESANDFISNHDVMIVPLLSGGGMRIKIIEAMAMGKTVISTSIGLEGINATHQQNVIVADSKEDFILEINQLIKNPNKIIEIGKRARLFVEEEHNNDQLVKSLISFANSL